MKKLSKRWVCCFVSLGVAACGDKSELTVPGTGGSGGAIQPRASGGGGGAGGAGGTATAPNVPDSSVGSGGTVADAPLGETAAPTDAPVGLEAGTFDSRRFDATSDTGGAGGAAGQGGAGGTGTGGRTGVGGCACTGGSTGKQDGGATTTVPTPSTVVTFEYGVAKGAMNGFTYVALGAADTLTSPTCGTFYEPITSSKPCSGFMDWSVNDKLCITGSIPALSETNPDYANNWGISIGVPATSPVGGGLGQAFSTITFTILGGATPGLVATVKRKSDLETVTYCANIASGQAIPFISFTRNCRDATNPGIALTAADVPTIEKLTVDVRSTATPIVVDNLCLTKVEFGW